MVLYGRSLYAWTALASRDIPDLNYATLLDVYTLEELLELNDKTPEECLEYLVDMKYIKLPTIKPLDFDD